MIKALLSILVFIPFLSWARSGEVPNIGNCGGEGSLISIQVDGCSTNPCFFAPGGQLNMTIAYNTSHASVTLVSKAWFYDFEDNYFDFWDAYQPGFVLPGTIATFQNATIIPPELKEARGFIIFQIWDVSLNSPAVCAEFEALTSARYGRFNKV